MAVAGVATGAVAAAAAATVSTPYPATVAAGALALCFCQSGNGSDPTPPTGWTLPTGATCAVGSTGTDASATKGYVFQRICDGTEGGTSVTVPWIVGHVIARIRTFSGHDATTPLTFSTAASAAVAQATVNTNSIAAKTNDANDLFLAFYAHDRDSTTSSSISGGDFTNLIGETTTTPVVNNTNLGGGGGIYVFEGDPAADSAGAVSHSANCTSTIWASLLIRINASGSMGATDYPMTAASGSYALTGTDSGLAAQRLLTADAGSYALTGAAVTFPLGKSMVAASGAYTLTGAAATLTAGRAIAATAGSYALTGAAANLQAQRQLVALAGSYTVTGTDAGLLAGRALDALAGSYALTGGDATLTYTPAGSANYTLAAAAGVYALVGGDAILTYIANEWFIRENAPPLVAPSQLAEPAAAGISPVLAPPPVSVSIAAAPGLGAFVRVPQPAAIELEG